MSPKDQNDNGTVPMKILAWVTSLLALVAVWGALLPMRYIVYQFPPDKTVASFARFGAQLPSGSAFLLHNLTMGKLYLIALLLSAGVIGLGVRAQRNARWFAGQASLLAGWLWQYYSPAAPFGVSAVLSLSAAVLLLLA